MTFLHKKRLTQLYNYSTIIKLIITIHLQISNYTMLNMWYINLKAYNSNHSRYCNSIFIRTIMFHTQLLRCWDQPSFSLSRRDDNSNRFQPAGNLFLTQTQVYQPRQPQVTFGTTQVHISLVRPAPHNQGGLAARTIRTTLPLGSRLAPRTSLLPSRVCTFIEWGSARVELLGFAVEMSYPTS